jgi:hypothetical protein
MNNEYRIEPGGQGFIERCKREDEMHEAARQFVDIAIKAHMRKLRIGRKTAQFWIHGAMGG